MLQVPPHIPLGMTHSPSGKLHLYSNTKNAEKARRYRERKKHDPEYRRKDAERKRLKRSEIRKNPELLKTEREKSKLNMARWRREKKLQKQLIEMQQHFTVQNS